VKTWTTPSTFFTFFDMTFKKRKNSRFVDFEKMVNKKAVLPQGNRAMPQVFFSVEVRQQHSLQV